MHACMHACMHARNEQTEKDGMQSNRGSAVASVSSSIVHLKWRRSDDDPIIAEGNDALEDTAGLRSLRTVGEQVIIEDNYALRTLRFENLGHIRADLVVSRNIVLECFCGGLERLQSVGGCVDVNSNDALRNFSGLSSLTTIGCLSVEYGPGHDTYDY